MVAGDLSALRFIRAQSLYRPYRRVLPLEMTVLAGSIQSFTEGQIDQNDAPRPVISTVAKRSGEISLRSVARPRVAGDLSTLRFNRDEYLSLITTGSPARDDDACERHWTHLRYEGS